MFSLLLLPVFSFRIARKEMPKIQAKPLNESDVIPFINRHERSIVFFIETYQAIKGLSRVLLEDESIVEHGYATPSAFSNQFCISYPCATAFHYGKHLKTSYTAFTPIQFEIWSMFAHSPSDVVIGRLEQLRQLLNFPGSHVISISNNLRPEFVPINQTVFYASRSHFAKLGFKLAPGVYVYRSTDRELIEIKEWDQNVFEGALVSIQSTNLTESPYLVGVFLDHLSNSADKAKIATVSRIAKEYNKKGFRFTAFNDEEAYIMSYITGLSHVCGPLMVVLNTSDFSGDKWAFSEYSIVNSESAMKKILDGVADGSLPKSPLSLPVQEKLNPGLPNRITPLDFDEKVMKSASTSLVFITSSCHSIQPEFIALMKAAAKIYRHYNVVVFEFDQGVQDTVEHMPLFRDFPQILAFSPGLPKQQPHLYSQDLSLNNFLSFMKEVTGGAADLKESEIKAFRQELIKETQAANQKTTHPEEL